jgi:cell division protein FtsN
MANVEHEDFESRADTIRAFDFDEEGSAAEEGARLPFLVLIALVVLGAFVGVVWLAYTQGVERGRAEAPQILAQRDLRPPTTATQTPPFTGLNIYQSRTPGEPAAPQNIHPAATRSFGPVHAETPPPALRPSSNGGTESFAPGTKPAHPFATTPPAPAPPSKAAETPKSQASAALAPAPAGTSQSPAAQVNGVLLQIGSYKSETEARQAGAIYQTHHPAAAGYGIDISRADLGARGIWYRLRIGPFEDKDAAAEACAKLRSDGATCLISR